MIEYILKHYYELLVTKQVQIDYTHGCSCSTENDKDIGIKHHGVMFSLNWNLSFAERKGLSSSVFAHSIEILINRTNDLAYAVLDSQTFGRLDHNSGMERSQIFVKQGSFLYQTINTKIGFHTYLGKIYELVKQAKIDFKRIQLKPSIIY